MRPTHGPTGWPLFPLALVAAVACTRSEQPRIDAVAEQERGAADDGLVRRQVS
jgi:hypothetical protein